MSEIERAIETIKEDYETAIEYGDDERAVFYGNILKLLRAELDREKNDPQRHKCDGCKSNNLYEENCSQCNRYYEYTDCYEPEGENE